MGVVTSAKLTNYRIEQLEKKVDKHNTVIERHIAGGDQAVIRNIGPPREIGDLEKGGIEYGFIIFSNYGGGHCEHLLDYRLHSKKWVKRPGQQIHPTMVAILGAALNIWIAGSVSRISFWPEPLAVLQVQACIRRLNR